MVHGRGRCRATAAGGARHGFPSCVHSTRVVFNPSKVKIRVRVPMDAKPVIFFSPSFPRDEWIFGIPYTMVVNLRLDGRAVQGAGFRHQSLRRRGFESHSSHSTCLPVSLVGQDTWFSPMRPGFESRTGNFCDFYFYD